MKHPEKWRETANPYELPYHHFELKEILGYPHAGNDVFQAKQPPTVNECFCHGDFHFANILWENKHISAILDFELSGWGNKEFDIAWALILRPGQKFLNTKAEIDLFLKGYASLGSYNEEYVKYYMVLIYTYFYKFRGNEQSYLEYIRGVFQEYCG